MGISPTNTQPRKRRRIARRRDPLANLPAPLRDWLTETLVPAGR